MKKWIFIGGGAIVVLVIVGVIMLATNLGPMIKTAVNKYGPEITQTDVRLGAVDISIFSAEAKLKDFLLGNPKGFTSPHAMKVGAINLNVDEKSITGNPIIIDKIEVLAPEISYEKIGNTDNFKAILNNVKKTAGADKKAAEKKSDKEGSGKKIIIRNFIVKGGKVNLTMSMLPGQIITASFPDIHLKDIGKKKGGETAAEAFDEIFKSLYSGITSPDVTANLNQGLKSLGSSFEALRKGSPEGIIDAQKGIESLKDVEKGAEDVTKTLKGLFGN